MQRKPRLAAAAGISAAVLAATVVVAPAPASSVTVSNLSAITRTPGTTLNLRSCASTSCQVLRRVPDGTVLSLSRASGDWFRTSWSGATGWVHSRYTVLRGTPATAVTRGNTSRRMVAFTFDAGADLGYTAKILDYLRDHHMRASFGMTGTWAQAHPTYVQRMVDEGHVLINHTWDHPSFTGYSTGTAALTPARRIEELVRLQKKVVAITGVSTRPYFRPPYGDTDAGVLRDVGANGYRRSVMWSVDSLGWNGLSASKICDRVTGAMSAASNGGNGYIVLFHVGSASQDANALSCITSRLRDRGFSFGTITQVLAP